MDPLVGRELGLLFRILERLERDERNPRDALSRKGHQRSLWEVSAALSAMGFANANGQPFSASSIRSMIEA